MCASFSPAEEIGTCTQEKLIRKTIFPLSMISGQTMLTLLPLLQVPATIVAHDALGEIDLHKEATRIETTNAQSVAEKAITSPSVVHDLVPSALIRRSKTSRMDHTTVRD